MGDETRAPKSIRQLEKRVAGTEEHVQHSELDRAQLAELVQNLSLENVRLRQHIPGLVAAHLRDRRQRRAEIDDVNLQLFLALSLAEDANCIDVGAYQGRILSDIVRFAPKGHHIAYEPLPPLHSSLTSDFPQVDVRCAALSNVESRSSFNYVRNLPAYSGLCRRSYPEEPKITMITVPTHRLDDHLPPGYVPDLIKIDVEGAEYWVLEGAWSTITTHRPAIVFECSKSAQREYGTNPGQVFDLLCEEAGLRIFDLDGNGPYTRRGFETSDYWNFVAHR